MDHENMPSVNSIRVYLSHNIVSWNMSVASDQDEQYAKFLAAADYLSSKLKIDHAKITNHRGDNRAFSRYSSTVEGDEYTFRFSFSIIRRRGKIGHVLASVSIYYNCASARFDVDDDITEKKLWQLSVPMGRLGDLLV